MSRRKKVDYAEDSSEEDEDFSASEDEWQPKEDDEAGLESEDEDDEDFDANTTAKIAKRRGSISKGKSRASSSSSSRKSIGNRTISTLRSRMIRKYNPRPHILPPSPAKPISKNISKILQSSQYQSKKAIASSQDDDDSESSGDDYLVNPNQLDLKSSFFDIGQSSKTATETTERVPEFDCNAGMKLSDSEDDDENVENEMVEFEISAEVNDAGYDDEVNTERSKSSNLIAGINKTSAGQVDFHKLIQYNKEAQEAEEKLKNAKSTTFKNDDNLNVLKLLALGEGTSSASILDGKEKVSKKRKKTTKAGSDSESDWEHVQDESETVSSGVKEILQINIPLAIKNSEAKKKGSQDVEMMIKRRMNRDIKEQRVYLHKVSLLCYIAHGLYCNKVLNDPHLMAAALKLLPNKSCYPDGQTCIKYFESIAKWYKQAIPVRKNQMYLGTTKHPKLGLSLAFQIKYKEALCKKYFVLIFIILLRAMGFPCRLVINLTPITLHPPQSELHSLSTKAKEEKKSGGKKSESQSETKSDDPKKKRVDSKTSKDSRKDTDQKFEEPRNEEKNKKVEKSKEKTSEKNKSRAGDKSSKTSKSSQDKDQKGENHSKTANAESSGKVKQNRTEKSREDNNQKHLSSSLGKHEDASVPNKKKKGESDSDKSSKHIGEESAVKQGSNVDTENLTLSEKLKKRAPNKRAVISKSKSQKETAKEVGNNNEPPLLKVPPKAEVSEDIMSIASTSQGPLVSIKEESKVVPKKTLSQKLKQNSNSKKKVPIESETTDHFKETQENILKEKTASPKPAKETSSSGTKRKGRGDPIYFQAPTKRNTRSATKEQQKNGSTENVTIPQLDGADDVTIKSKKLKSKSRKPSNSDDDFVPSPPKKVRPTVTSTNKKDRRVLSSSSGSDEDDKIKKKKVDMWVEVYAEKEKKWVPINLFKSQVDNPDELRKSATSPVCYVFAWNNDNTLKDVSPRYCPQWNTATRKQRVEKEWLQIAIEDYLEKNTSGSRAEDVELLRMHLDKPLPTSIGEYKNHPLYALQRHLLKFEAIYPPNPVTLGFVRGEPVYSRDCVHTLHSRETWLKSARVVKPGETPYKIVKARPKWDKYTNSVITDLPLEIFGKWQTMDYDPPTAMNGIVPRNAYGNVDMFKPCMLPKKTVHLDLPGLNRVCKKIKVDCAPAVVGFDFHQGACHPLIEGYIVCEEFRDKVVDAWNREQEEAERKEDAKYYTRVYGNWKKLYRGLLIRERLKRKYNFKTLKIDDGRTNKKNKKV